MRIIAIILLLSLYACGDGTPAKSNIDTAAVNNEPVQQQRGPVQVDNDTVINIRFPEGGTSVTVEGKMRGITQPVNVYIPVTIGSNLTASLSTNESLANIRFSHIYTPDGKSDGPFGRELKREITQKGTYKLVISENQMQGDEWKGDFLLTVKVE